MNNTFEDTTHDSEHHSPFTSVSSGRLYSRESFAATTTTTTTSSSSSSAGKGSRKGVANEKFTTDTDTDQESLPASFRGHLEGSLSSSLKSCDRNLAAAVAKSTKKLKRVQFQDGK